MTNTNQDQKEREAFEKWMETQKGSHTSFDRHRMFSAWQARGEYESARASKGEAISGRVQRESFWDREITDHQLIEKSQQQAHPEYIGEFTFEADSAREPSVNHIFEVAPNAPAPTASAKPDKVEDGGNLLARLGTDGHLWAEEMHKHFPSATADELLGWCCNMIMAGWDESHRRCMKRTPTEEELLEAVSALYGCREVLGDAANIQHAINCIEKYLPKKDTI